MITNNIRTLFLSLCMTFLTTTDSSLMAQVSGRPGVFRMTLKSDEKHLYKLHGSSYYFLSPSLSPEGNFQLHDLSAWFIEPSQRQIVSHWHDTDIIFIKPASPGCFSFFKKPSDCPYVFQNRCTHEVIKVGLIAPPHESGSYTRKIVRIDRQCNQVILNDQTTWTINPNLSFNEWREGHMLIIGVNNKWRTAKYPHILINTGIYETPYCEASVL